MSEAERAEIAIKRAAHIVAEYAKVPVDRVLNPRGAEARRLWGEAIYLAATAADVPKRQMWRVVGVSRWGLQKAISRLADRRDEDPNVDARLARLERKMGMVA